MSRSRIVRIVATVALTVVVIVLVAPRVPQHEKAARVIDTGRGDTTKQAVTLPHGLQVYSIAQADDTWPRIREATIDPLDVHVGDRQTIEAVIESRFPVDKVTAEVQTDNYVFPVVLNYVGVAVAPVDPLGRDQVAGLIPTAHAQETIVGRYRGAWDVRDTHDTTYHTTIRAEAGSDESSVVLAWTDACGIPYGGDYTISSPCSITSADGVDNGNIVISSSLTLSANFARNNGKSLTISGGGSIAVNNGSTFLETNIWMFDADADGYPASTAQSLTGLAEQGQRRRYVIDNFSTPDCDDSTYSLSNTCGSAATLVAQWTFSEMTGNEVADSINGNNGYIDTRRPSWVSDGPLCTAYNFQGDFMTVADASVLRLTDDMSLNFLWYAPDGTNELSSHPFVKGNEGTGIEYTFQFQPGGGASGYISPADKWSINAEVHDGAWESWLDGTGAGAVLQPQTWNMITIVREGPLGKIYENGQLLGTSNFGFDGVTSGTGDLVIGNFGTDSQLLLSDIRLYDGALAQSEIDAIYQSYPFGQACGIF